MEPGIDDGETRDAGGDRRGLQNSGEPVVGVDLGPDRYGLQGQKKQNFSCTATLFHLTTPPPPFWRYAAPGLHRLRELFSIDDFPAHPNPPRRPLSGPR